MMALVRFSHVFSKIYTILLILVSVALYETILKIRSASRWARMKKILPCLMDKSTVRDHVASFIESLPAAPQIELDDGSLSSESKSKSGECAICLSRFRGGGEGEVARELHCKHLFHQKCIRRWVETSDGATCPLCRKSLILGLGGASLQRWQSEEDCIVQEKLCSWFLSWNGGNELHRLVWAR